MSNCCNQLINANEINAYLARFLSIDSEIVYREIFMLQTLILDHVNSCLPCKTQCITVDNDTPFTYYPYIKSVKVHDGGQGYFPVTPVATIISNTGYDAKIELEIDNGVIQSASVIESGDEYSIMDQVSVIHPNGQGAILSASISGGKISGVTVMKGGSGYNTFYPNVILSESGEGYGAVFSPMINLTDGSIEKIDVIDGGFYYSVDTLARIDTPDDSSACGAVISLDINEPPIENVNNMSYYKFIALNQNECNAKNHIGAVLNFFREKGYKISAEINPKSQSTMQWTICWC